MDENKTYYVYEWYNEETGDVFYVGKGHGDRYKQKSKTKRNRFFMRYINKYRCASRIIIDNLTEEEAYEKEREIISQYKLSGIQLVNFDEGGRRGGRCPGELNPMYGKTHSKEAIEKIKAANRGGKNAKENNSQWKVSPKERMSPNIYEQWREKQRQRKFGDTNPNAHQVILFDINHNEIRRFGNIKECSSWLNENEHLNSVVENIRSKIKYYSGNGHLMLQKYYVRIIRPIKHENTVPSLCNEEGVTTIESIAVEKPNRE